MVFGICSIDIQEFWNLTNQRFIFTINMLNSRTIPIEINEFKIRKIITILIGNIGYVEKRKEITSQELLDLASVAKSLPGAMIGNVAMLYGYRVGGLAGGFAAVCGMILPPFAVIVVISFFYAAFRANPWVNAAMVGMQAAVVPIIFSAAINLVKGSMPYPPCVLLMILAAAAYLFTDINPIILVILGVVLGLVIGSYYERRSSHDPS